MDFSVQSERAAMIRRVFAYQHGALFERSYVFLTVFSAGVVEKVSFFVSAS